MAKGGARKGSGRKAGSVNIKTRDIAAQAMESGITPLEVMTNIMRETYAKALTEANPLIRGKLLEVALSSAKDAAPYMHPRLSTVEVGNKSGEEFKMKNCKDDSDAELNTRLIELLAKTGAGGVVKNTRGKAPKRD